MKADEVSEEEKKGFIENNSVKAVVNAVQENEVYQGSIVSKMLTPLMAPLSGDL